ncbi:hypothetical protein [Pseudolactococcus insecticola]|uniref:Beta-1,6-galactofuranosyltransferase n=1 Tax=Pseudolactococcus insecticola TaxID=2709158 RepID=A0A6A0B9E7_9LACT|nr:hypothetical protein [Lactococcus insecticola]GFH40954.1 hypothetical protein Hs20B_13520 [Lactococcus insecticola]
MQYFTQNPVSEEAKFNAIGKVTADYAQFFGELGMKNLDIPDRVGAGGAERLFAQLTPEDVVFYQYPSYYGLSLAKETIIVDELVKKGVKIVVLVHDAYTLTYELEENNQEIALLNRADAIILHGPKMQAVMEEKGLTTPSVVQGPFGYRLTDDEIAGIDHKVTEKTTAWETLYTGNLGKAWFAIDYEAQTHMILYGPLPKWAEGQEKPFKGNLDYRGKVAPEELPVSDFKGFGLVWDGTHDPDYRKKSRYTAYNMPLKVSNYLAHELPLVVWSKSAIAEFVLENKIGLALDDLNEVDAALADISAEDYNQMVENMQTIGASIRDGQTIKNAVVRALEVLSGTKKIFYTQVEIKTDELGFSALSKATADSSKIYEKSGLLDTIYQNYEELLK